MIDDFEMAMSKTDFLRILNKGLSELSGYFGRLIQQGDKVTGVRYSRRTKRYTLICKSGQEIRVEKAGKKRETRRDQNGLITSREVLEPMGWLPYE